MKQKTQAVYRIQEFARMAGVTVRTLRHYDRLGLLTPTARSGAGYRLYSESDSARLERIVVLKFLGLPLTRIGQLLRRESALVDALTSQRQTLRHKRGRLAAAIDSIDQATRALAAGGEPAWSQLAAVVKEIGEQKDPEKWWRRRQLAEARKTIWTRRMNWNATLQDYQLWRDIKIAAERGDTPATPAGQALVARWRDAMVRFTGGDPDIQAALNLVMADRGHWPGPTLSPELREFFECAMKSA